MTKAIRAFWENGYEATSIADLTAAMGIAAPSLYAAFGDKKALFTEAIEAYQRRYGGFQLRALEEEPTARAAIARILREAARLYVSPGSPPGCLVTSVMVSAKPAAADLADMLRQQRDQLIDRLRRRIAADVASGALPANADPRALAAFTAAVLQGMSQRARDGANAAELSAIAETALHAWPRPEAAD